MTSIYNLLYEKIDAWLKNIILLLPNLLIAIFVLLLGIWISKKVKNLANKFLNNYSERKILNNLIVNFIHITFLSLVGFTVLSILNLDKAVTSILAGIGVLSLGLAFAFQDLATNLMSGIIISFRRPINVGDYIDVKDVSGVVVEVNLRDTVIHTLQGKKIIMPNKILIESPVINHTANHHQRMELQVGIGYDSQLENVKQITISALQGISDRDVNKNIEFYYTEFGDSAIIFTAFVWLTKPDKATFLKARSNAIINIKNAFDSHNINIPFPIRTLYYKDTTPISITPK
ncbi:MAG TPA: mechanosensitive ion channel family protein [Saprospiraceae bacterium]|nr:mechanosensitive ion channel family protein [Saprospiraceae bacterium]